MTNKILYFPYPPCYNVIRKREQSQRKRVINLDLKAQLITPEQAAGLVSSGDSVWVGNSLSVSNPFIEALLQRSDELRDVTLIGNGLAGYDSRLLDRRFKDSFKIVSFLSDNSRSKAAPDDNVVPYLPPMKKEYFDSIFKAFGINVIAVELYPPDYDGYCDPGPLDKDFTLIISRFPGIRRRIAIIRSDFPPSEPDSSLIKIPLNHFDYVCQSEPDSVVSLHERLMA